MMCRSNLVRGAALALLGLLACGEDLADEAGAARIELHWGVKIPMRDGVHLNGTLYAPKGQQAPAPCVMTLTPYIGDTYHSVGIAMASKGLPYMVVDVRGRGNSEGEFWPYAHEARDGYDVVEWLARQPYCNGKVGMWGGSYTGFDQWSTARGSPPHLGTIVPAAAAYPGVDTPMFKNIFYLSDTQWWPTEVAGKAAQSVLGGDHDFWDAKFREWYESGRPFKDLGQVVGNPSPDVFAEWLAHPQQDSYWDAYTPTPAEYAGMRIPVLSITGSYDNTQSSALTFYRAHQKYAPADVRDQHYLVIGPWDHPGTHDPRTEIDGLHFGPESLVDLNKLHVDWYRWVMAAGPRPEFLLKRVAYYVMGAERWRYSDSLEGITAQSRPYFLDSVTNAVDPFLSGSLRPDLKGSGRPDHYVYDPRIIRPPDIKPPPESPPEPGGMLTQASVMGHSGWQLIYHTAPFESDTEVSGFFKLSAWLSIDQPDTDFSATVYEIDGEGRSVYLANDVVRARYRAGLREKEQLVRSKTPLQYDFVGFSFVSRLIRKGHRLRLTVGPVDPLEMGMEKNYNSGGVVTEESMRDARAVTVALVHDANHPSALYVPLAQPLQPNEPSAPPAALQPPGTAPLIH